MILAVHMSLGSSPEKREQNAAALREVQEAVHRVHMGGKFVGSNPPSLVKTFSGYVQQAVEKWEESLRSFSSQLNCGISQKLISKDTISIIVSPKDGPGFFLPPWQELHDEWMSLGKRIGIDAQQASPQKQVMEGLSYAWKNHEYFRNPLAIAYLFDRPPGDDTHSVIPRSVKVLW